MDGKVLKRSYQVENDNPNSDSHPAIMLVSAYLVERGLILEPCEKDFPHIDFTLATTGFWFWNHVTQKFILSTGQIAGVCFTHVAHESAVYYLFTGYTERAF